MVLKVVTCSRRGIAISSYCTVNTTIVCPQALLYFTEMTSDINVQDSDGWSPLMYAAKAEASTIVKYLLQRGADPNVRQVGTHKHVTVDVVSSPGFPPVTR